MPKEAASPVPRVSIVIPAFNCADTIEHCIESVLTDSHQNTEVIVVDNASTDTTAHVVRGLRKGRERDIVLVREDRTGANAARNAGLRSATGEYVQFLDADDRITNDKLHASVQAFSASAELVCVYTDGINSGGRRSRILAAHENIWRLAERDFREFTCGLCTPAPIWKRKYLMDNLPAWDEDLRCWQESEYYFRLLLGAGSANTILHIPEIHFVVAKSAGSISSRKNSDGYMRSQYDALTRMKEYAVEQKVFNQDLDRHYMSFIKDLAKRSVVSGEEGIWSLIMNDLKRGRRNGSLPLWAYMPYSYIRGTYVLYHMARRRSP